MNAQETQNYGAALSPTYFSTEKLPITARNKIEQDACEVIRTVVKRNLVENGYAMIQNTAMNNVANLSMLEQQLVQIAPNAEARLRVLVDNYTFRCDQRLGGK